MGDQNREREERRVAEERGEGKREERGEGKREGKRKEGWGKEKRK